MNNLKFCAALGLFAAALYLVILPAIDSLLPRRVTAEDSRRMVYVCQETGALTVGPPQPTPAVNPETGRATLVSALYCPKCERWRAAPPLELLQRNPSAGQCPKHRVPLTTDGPLPAASPN